MTDYNSIYNKMELNKFYTAKDLGVAPASMTAMLRRNLVKVVSNSSPKTYQKIDGNSLVWICQMVEQHLPKDKEFFTVNKANRPYGMMCTLKNNTVMDCYGKPYNLDEVVSLEINHTVYPFQ